MIGQIRKRWRWLRAPVSNRWRWRVHGWSTEDPDRGECAPSGLPNPPPFLRQPPQSPKRPRPFDVPLQGDTVSLIAPSLQAAGHHIALDLVTDDRDIEPDGTIRTYHVELENVHTGCASKIHVRTRAIPRRTPTGTWGAWAPVSFTVHGSDGPESACILDPHFADELQPEPMSDTKPNTITAERVEEILAASTYETAKLEPKTTVVCATLPNGFQVTAHSACVDPANYDHEIGVEIAKKRIADDVWKLEGYLLQQRLSENWADTEAKFVDCKSDDE